MRPPVSDLYNYAIRSIPILCITGLVTILGGVFTRWTWMMKLGTGLFLSGFAVWGFANGGIFALGLFHTVRRHGFRAFREQPWYSVYYIVLMLFLLAAGMFFVKFIFRAAGSGE